MAERAPDDVDVSVVIATRNRKELLAEAIASVRRQAGVRWELIVVDDGSTDGTWRWLTGLGEPAVRCFRSEIPAERSAARNLGLAHAHGRFVMFLDDDDLLHDGALAVLVRALAAHADAVAAVGARRDWFVEEGYRRRDVHVRFSRRRDVFEELLFGWSAVSGQNLIRTAVARDVGGYDGTIIPCEDRDLWLRLARRGPVVLRPETVMTYRVHRGQRRPADLRRIRERVARRAIQRLPRASWRRGIVIRRCAALVGGAEEELRARRYARGITLAMRALALAPGLMASPLIGLWLARRLAASAWHGLRGI